MKEVSIEKARVEMWERGIRSAILEEKRRSNKERRLRLLLPLGKNGSRQGGSDIIFQLTQKTKELLPELTPAAMRVPGMRKWTSGWASICRRNAEEGQAGTDVKGVKSG